jgi:hypothetical protein
MAVAKWNTPSAEGSNIAGTALDSVANGSASSAITYDNSTNLDLYGRVRVELGSITPVTGGSITLRVYNSAGSNVEDFGGGGDAYTVPLTTSAGAKRAIFPMVRLYPWSLRFVITNSAGVTLAATGNQLFVTPFAEAVS